MQEDIERRTIAVAVDASKLTDRVLARVCSVVVQQIKEGYAKSQTPQGRQSVKKLMNHCTTTNSIPLDGDTKLFDKMAQKYNIDYAFHKTGTNKYLLFFKAGQADAITACFSEYSKRAMSKSAKRPSILEQLKKFGELIKSRGHEPAERTREAMRDER